MQDKCFTRNIIGPRQSLTISALTILAAATALGGCRSVLNENTSNNGTTSNSGTLESTVVDPGTVTITNEDPLLSTAGIEPTNGPTSCEFSASASSESLSSRLIDGVRPLTVVASVTTMTADSSLGDSFLWSVDEAEQIGDEGNRGRMTHTFTTAGIHTIALSLIVNGLSVGCTSVQDSDFNAQVVVWPMIDGQVIDDQGKGVSGAVVSADGRGQTAITDDSGYYKVSVPFDWSGQVVVQHADYDFPQNAHTYSGLRSDIVPDTFVGTLRPDPAVPPANASCVTDADCDDGLFCNGTETCANGLCQVGSSPCEQSLCDEALGQCINVGCALDSECDDGVYCNGAESCRNGTCLSGVSPCQPGDTCNETNRSCIMPSNCSTSATTWQNTAIDSHSGRFEVEFDAIPNDANMDGTVTLGSSPGSTWSDFAVLINFSVGGTILVRNGGSYQSDVPLSYSPSSSYHFRLDIDVPSHRYSVYVTPADGLERTLALNYGFRTEQATVSSLGVWSMWSGVGSQRVCNFVVGGCQQDTDGDGVPNCNDGCPSDPNKTAPGACGCGVLDTDANNNGTADCNESGGSTQLAETFDSYAPGADPTNWFDTGANNSLIQDDSLFKTSTIGGAAAFGTSSTLTNIHSHYVAPGSSWGSMTFTGRMRLGSSSGGVGVTFVSGYPSRQAYYRLRVKQGGSFHIAPHATNITGGVTDSGVSATANVWYAFHIDVTDTGTRTEIRANVWPAGSVEPGVWQINCYDDSASRLTNGTIGVWSMTSGRKDWDDLLVQPVNCSQDSDRDGIADCQDVCPNTADPSQTDTDGDGRGDACDLCPLDNPDDSDGDGVCNSDDGCPNDPNKTVSGVCGCGISDVDSDSDGTPDCLDGCPTDPNKIAAGLCGCNRSDQDLNGNGIPDGCETQTTDRISQWGITWTFDGQYEFGQFVNGDYWVVGPVNITSISPAPSGGRNGSMINPIPGDDQAYDSRNYDYTPGLLKTAPLTLGVNESLVSTISIQSYPYLDITGTSQPNSGYAVSKTAAILTCLPVAPPSDAFRPPYVGSTKTLYRLSDVQWQKLPSLPAPSSTPSMATYIRYLQRPWIDHKPNWTSRMMHPSDNMPNYGRELAGVISNAACLLCLDFTNNEKEPLLIGMVQIGIDNYHTALLNADMWGVSGGHMMGRKFPILFAGLMLNHNGMLTANYKSSEDTSTYDGTQYNETLWTGWANNGQAPWTFTNPPTSANVMCTLNPYDSTDSLGKSWRYEHIHPQYWRNAPFPNSGNQFPDNKHEPYRRIITQSQVGQTIAARILGLRGYWNYQPYFDYMDRWMYENDEPLFATIQQYWYFASWNPQGGVGWPVGSSFVSDMYLTYRPDY